LSMKGFTAAELDRPPLNRWKTIINKVPVCLAASEFLKSTPHQYPIVHPIRLTHIAVIMKAKKYSALLLSEFKPKYNMIAMRIGENN